MLHLSLKIAKLHCQVQILQVKIAILSRVNCIKALHFPQNELEWNFHLVGI